MAVDFDVEHVMRSTEDFGRRHESRDRLLLLSDES